MSLENFPCGRPSFFWLRLNRSWILWTVFRPCIQQPSVTWSSKFSTVASSVNVHASTFLLVHRWLRVFLLGVECPCVSRPLVAHAVLPTAVSSLSTSVPWRFQCLYFRLPSCSLHLLTVFFGLQSFGFQFQWLAPFASTSLQCLMHRLIILVALPPGSLSFQSVFPTPLNSRSTQHFVLPFCFCTLMPHKYLRSSVS